MSRDLDRLRLLVARPNFTKFREEFDLALQRHATKGSIPADLSDIAAEAFQVFLERDAAEDPATLAWFVEQAKRGRIDTDPGLVGALRRAQRALEQRGDRRRHARAPASREVIQLKRVVQLSWFGIAGFEASDAFALRRSVFRSPQERTFARALSLRFPGLMALPNYPLDQIASLDRLRPLVSEETWRYGRLCRIDAVLVTPGEGDPIAAFELDSKAHDQEEHAKRDRRKVELLAAARIPLFRLHSEEPTATSVDEWYSILTDEVLDKVDCGERIRIRDWHSSLVPTYR